jgi:DnaJ-class molecular chaperone
MLTYKDKTTDTATTICSTCGGTGICTWCHGAGTVRTSAGMIVPCPNCTPAGASAGDGQCRVCNGRGTIPAT